MREPLIHSDMKWDALGCDMVLFYFTCSQLIPLFSYKISKVSFQLFMLIRETELLLHLPFCWNIKGYWLLKCMILIVCYRNLNDKTERIKANWWPLKLPNFTYYLPQNGTTEKAHWENRLGVQAWVLEFEPQNPQLKERCSS